MMDTSTTNYREVTPRVGDGLSNAGPKAILITNIPTPYRIPLFNRLHEELAKKGIAFKVVFGALGYPRRRWSIDMGQCSFPYDVLNATALRASSNAEHSPFTYGGLFRLLRREQPRVIITNGFSIATTKLWLRTLTRYTPYVIWSGAIRGTKREHWLRRWHRRMLVTKAKGYIAYGSRAKEYLSDYGACLEKVAIGINTVDTTYYSTGTVGLRNQTVWHGRTKHLVYLGHLTKGKNIDSLLRVACALKKERSDFVIDIIGSGPEENNLKSLTRQLNLDNVVRFHGFRQKDEVVGFLASAYCLVFPSTYDVWGLVLVEAMAAGVPCVSSVKAGATCDLIESGRTGFAVDFSDADAVATKLGWLLDHPSECEAMGRQARDFIESNASLGNSVAGFVTAIERVLEASA